MKKISILLLLLMAMVIIPSAGQDIPAQESADDIADESVDESSLIISSDRVESGELGEKFSVFTVWDFVRMVLILGAVVGVVYLIFFILKRSGNPRFQENQIIKVLSSKALANNRSLHVVGVGNQVFLVGSSDNGVSLVSEIIEKETLDGLRLQATAAEGGNRRTFADILSSVFGKPPGPGGATAKLPTGVQTTDSLSFLRQQRQKVKNM